MSLYANWSALVTRIYRWVWLGRIYSTPPRIPPGSLVVAAHYNGGVDGFVYGSQLPAFLAVVSSQWHGQAIGRLLFPGIGLVRAKDKGSTAGNIGAFHRMIEVLVNGDCLLFFPEGTSRLGTNRLPIQRGSLLLLRKLREISPQTPVFFTSANYYQPTLWRSEVAIEWVGPLVLPHPDELTESWVAEHLLKVQSVAYGRKPPADAKPLSRRPNALGVLLAGPYVPVWAGVAAIAHRIADEENVIALWKFLLGVPVTLVTAVLYTFASTHFGIPWWIPVVSLMTGARLWRN